ncbi:hypothetical protein PT2222_120278 [Paraburkholderia tropica]
MIGCKRKKFIYMYVIQCQIGNMDI